jgi:hypothetical protein
MRVSRPRLVGSNRSSGLDAIAALAGKPEEPVLPGPGRIALLPRPFAVGSTLGGSRFGRRLLEQFVKECATRFS